MVQAGRWGSDGGHRETWTELGRAMESPLATLRDALADLQLEGMQVRGKCIKTSGGCKAAQ